MGVAARAGLALRGAAARPGQAETIRVETGRWEAGGERARKEQAQKIPQVEQPPGKKALGEKAQEELRQQLLGLMGLLRLGVRPPQQPQQLGVLPSQLQPRVIRLPGVQPPGVRLLAVLLGPPRLLGPLRLPGQPGGT